MWCAARRWLGGFLASTAGRAHTLPRVERTDVCPEDRQRTAALPPAEKQPRAGNFDGTWTMTRSASPGCHGQAASFTVRINGSVAIGLGGRGSISPSGAIRVPGSANYFTGTLRGNSGGGTYSGKCTGTFTASRN